MDRNYTLREALGIFDLNIPPTFKTTNEGVKSKKFLSFIEDFIHDLFKFQQEIKKWSQADTELTKSILKNYEKNYNMNSDFPIYITLKKEIYNISDYELQQECVNATQSCQLESLDLVAISLIAAKNKNLIQAFEYAKSSLELLDLGDQETAELAHEIIRIYLLEIDLMKETNNSLQTSHTGKLFKNISQLLASCEPIISKGGNNDNRKETNLDVEAISNTSKQIRPPIEEFVQKTKLLAYESCKITNTENNSANTEIIEFEFDNVKFITNMDKSTNYHIRESSEKLRRLALFTPKSAKLIIDCGAHIGMFSALASRQSNNPKVILFEPDRELHYMITQNMQHCSNAYLYSCAVGGAHGEATFFKSKQSSQTSSLSKKATELFSKIDGIEERSVVVNKLSDFIDPNTIVDYLKIDVQGNELSIVEDLINHDILKNVNTLALESSFLDIKSIDCVDIIKNKELFKSAYLINTVYGGGDIVFSKLQASEDIAENINAHRIF